MSSSMHYYFIEFILDGGDVIGSDIFHSAVAELLWFYDMILKERQLINIKYLKIEHVGVIRNNWQNQFAT